MEDRFDRNVRFFGREGQDRLRATTVAIVGVGGLGTHIVQQLAYLGVGGFILIDNEKLDGTNLNRYIGTGCRDRVPGIRKVNAAEGLVNFIDPTITVRKVFDTLASKEAFKAILNADYVFGCLDKDGSRFILNELCVAYRLPYIDLASDIIPHSPMRYGGRVCTVWDDEGCLSCLEVLDISEVQEELNGQTVRREREAIYGVSRGFLNETGPSVVSINGVIASLAVTEFTVGLTGVRKPKKHLIYHGHLGKVTVNQDKPHADCYYCKSVRGKGENAGLERYIQSAGRPHQDTGAEIALG